MHQEPVSVPGIEQTIIETERLLLKEVNPDILTKVLTSFADEDIMSFLGLSTEAELATERNNYRLGLSWYRATSRAFLMIEKSSDKLAGRIGFHTWYTQHARAEIGYHLSDVALRRQGYMTEAMRAVIAHGFGPMRLNRIEAFVGSQNEPSLRLMARFGFTREGLLRSHYFKNGIMEDSVCFSLLRSDYDSPSF